MANDLCTVALGLFVVATFFKVLFSVLRSIDQGEHIIGVILALLLMLLSPIVGIAIGLFTIPY